jgi:ATP-binding cassette subfamily B protein RaxB
LIARALYRRPRILILDEGTSHLDLENERAVNAALSQLAITRLVVAHRPETLRAAGRVVSLEGGVAREQSREDESPPASAPALAISTKCHD